MDNHKDEALARLEKELAAAKRAADPIRAERTLFLVSLIQARLRKHLSQAELATKTGMRQSAISRIESGRGNPSLRTLLMIAKALDVNLVVE